MMFNLLNSFINWLQSQLNPTKSPTPPENTQADTPVVPVVDKVPRKKTPSPGPPPSPFDLKKFIQTYRDWIETNRLSSIGIAVVTVVFIVSEYFGYRWWIALGTFLSDLVIKTWASFPNTIIIITLILVSLVLIEFKWVHYLYEWPLKILLKFTGWSLTRWIVTIITIFIVAVLFQYFISNANTWVVTSVEVWSETALNQAGETIAVQFRGNLNAIGTPPLDLVLLTGPNAPAKVNKARSSLNKLSLEDCSDIMLGPASFLALDNPISLSRSSDVHQNQGTGGQISLNTTIGTFNLPIAQLEQMVRFFLTFTPDYREFSVQIIPAGRLNDTDITSLANVDAESSSSETNTLLKPDNIQMIVTASNGQNWMVQGSSKDLPHLINFMSHRIHLAQLSESGDQSSNQINGEDLALALGNQAYIARDFNTALIYYRLADWFQPRNVTIQTMLGITLYQLSTTASTKDIELLLQEKARQIFIRANAQESDNPDIFSYLACLLKDEDQTQAQAQIDKFNDALEPDSSAAKQERIAELRRKPPLGAGRHVSVIQTTTSAGSTFDLYYIAGNTPYFQRWRSDNDAAGLALEDELPLPVNDEVRQIFAVEDGIYYLTAEGLLKFIRPYDAVSASIIDANKLQFNEKSLRLGSELNRLYTGGIRQLLAVNKELLFLVDRFGRILRLRITRGTGTGGLNEKLESFVDFDARQIALDGDILYVLKEDGTIWRISNSIDGDLSTATGDGSEIVQTASGSQKTVTALQLVNDTNNREIVVANGIIYILRTNGNVQRYIDQESAAGILTIDQGSQTSTIFIAPQGLFVLKNNGGVFLIRNPQEPGENDVVSLDELPQANRVAINVIGPILAALERGGQGNTSLKIHQPQQLINNDPDGDGLTTAEELAIETDPNNYDTDGDMLSDGEEQKTFGTNPLNVDTDFDGISDGDELRQGFLNPLSPDTDEDGIPDAEDCPENIARELTNLMDNPVNEKLGCPRKVAVGTWAAWQQFENGLLLYRQDLNLIYVLNADNTWATVGDTWREGDMNEDRSLTPPDGLYQPVRGFGKVWREKEGIQDALGWGITQERGFNTTIQEFTSGSVWYNPEIETFIILFNDDTYHTVPQ